MTKALNFLRFLTFAIFLLVLVLPAALAFFALSLVLSFAEFFCKGVEDIRDALDATMKLLCEAFEDWLP
jgi:hypothetical protein